MKKTVILLMIFSLIITAMAGCSSRDKNDNEDKTPDGILLKGRYLEENIEFPPEVDSAAFVSLAISPDANIELYTYNNSNYEKYLYVDKEWSKEDFDTFNKFRNPLSLTVTKIFYGEDGNLYFIGNTPNSSRSILYRQSGNGEYEQVDVAAFKENNKELNYIPYQPNSIRILENGMIAAIYLWGELEVYSSDGQSVIDTFFTGRHLVLEAKGNTIYYTSQDNNEILSMDMERNRAGSSIPFDMEKNRVGSAIPFDMEISQNGVIKYDGKTAYLCDITGIHINKEGGSIWETIVDSNQSSLGMPSSELTDFMLGTEDDFYIVLNDTDSYTIKHIYYDENIDSVPQTELSIFSIQDNTTIRQAIYSFQENNPNVKINFRVAKINQKTQYTYGIKDPDETITLQDYINALNTELLADKGADILVLDSLPVDSYIEKDVLEDMGSIFKPMIESGELLTNIAGNYLDDDKVYAMPIRFSLPVIYGSEDAVNAANSLGELADYARSGSKTPLLNPSNYRALAAWFLMTNYCQITNQFSEVDEVALRSFLDNIRIISDAIKASDDTPLDYAGSDKGREVGFWVSPINLHKKVVQTNIGELDSIFDFAIPLAAAEQWKGTFKIINNSYKANGLVGINSAGSHKELALEFIKLLFSKEIQSINLMDGFPVNTEALEEWIRMNGQNSFSFSDGGYMIHAFYPPRAYRDDIYNQICALETPMVNDTIIVDMILDQAEQYLRGDITAEQTVKNIVSSINIYINE